MACEKLRAEQICSFRLLGEETQQKELGSN